MNNKNLIACTFGMSMRKITMLNIINKVEYIDNDTFQYTNMEGLKTRTVEEFKNMFPGIELVSFDEIDIKDSLFYWLRDNPNHYDKPIVIDEDISTGEVYKGIGWVYSLMLFPTDTEIKVKLKID